MVDAGQVIEPQEIPKISVVILTFNSREYINRCLESLFSQDVAALVEVMVVDNNSSDGTTGFIKKEYPQVKIIQNDRNVGTAKARNQAFRISRGEWILALDCDIVLGEGFLSEIAKVASFSPLGVGMIQPKILMAGGKRVYSAGIYLSFLRRFYDIGRGKLDTERFNRQAYLFGVCSAAALYRRRMLEEIKEGAEYFDEKFFFLVEDVDLSWRAQRKGWKALYAPAVFCYHHGNSSCFDKKLRQLLCLRNRYYLIRKNEGLVKYALKLVPLLCYDLPRLLLILCSNRYIFKKSAYLK